ncbi:MAG: thioredoxin fold domain-containing protein [Planctomycetes bacterium]|nr:thioredoxin fold domain-containing protein [Planctomycetota bacterium]
METGRPMLLHFWKHGCPPCERMERSVFPHPDVDHVIRAGYVPVKINATESPNLARRYNVRFLPTDVIVSPTGQVLAMSNAPKSPAAYVARLQHFSGDPSRQVAYGEGNTASGYEANRSASADRWSATNNQPYRSAAPSSQAPNGRQQHYAATPQPNDRYQGAAGARNNAAPRTGGGQVRGYATQNHRSSPADSPSFSPGQQQRLAGGSPAPYKADSQRGAFKPQTPGDQFGRQPAPQVARSNVGAPGLPRNRPSGSYPSRDPKGAAPAWNGGNSPDVNAPQFSQPSNPYNNVNPGGQPTYPKNERGRPLYADQPRPQQQAQRPGRDNTYNDQPQDSRKPRPDISRFALEGHCPVTLQEQQNLHPSQRRWTPGDERWGARHEGRVYLFAGPEEQRKFLDNPNRYAPVLQGLDPVLAFDRQQMIPGQRKHGVYYEGRIYLFANENTLQHFSTNPQRYNTRALQAVKPQRGVQR